MFNYQFWKNDLYPINVNMALEEFFLKHSAETKKATLRLWSVTKDSGVLGYSQDTDVIKKIDSDFNVVRRASGGSHIQIGPNILAYTMTVPRDGSFKKSLHSSNIYRTGTAYSGTRRKVKTCSASAYY